MHYGFSYDPLNRLTAADYGHFEVLAPANPIVIPAPQKVPTQHYSVPSISYDAVGNITGITRMGRMPALPDNCFDKHEIDRLTMAYHPTENRLLSVQDAAPPAARHLGFKPSGGQPAPYQYDQNGNLTLDTDKSLSISYNFLNLPSQLGSLGILYNATGRKWRKAGQSTTTLYSNGIEYRDGKLEAIYLPDGRLAAEYAGSSIARYRAEYFHQDHLGNTRLAFSDFNQDNSISLYDDPATPESELEITQEAHYYPFGMGHLGPWYESVSPENRYLYNGKELNDEEGVGLYDFGFRWYDAAYGRFVGVDPIAEAFPWVNGFNYAENEPVANIDLWGLQKYFSADGKFIRQIGYDGSIWIIPESLTEDLKNLDLSQGHLPLDAWASLPAYEKSDAVEVQIFKPWALEYVPRSFEREYAMSLFEKNLTDKDGTIIEVVITGTTAAGKKKSGGGASVDILDSKAMIGDEHLKGWKRSSTIHTHPYGKANEFSGIDTNNQFMGGDIQWAKRNNVTLYLATREDPWVWSFSPVVYNQIVVKGSDGYIYRSDHKKAALGAIKREFNLRK